jgi:hypothetical protein
VQAGAQIQLREASSSFPSFHALKFTQMMKDRDLHFGLPAKILDIIMDLAL